MVGSTRKQKLAFWTLRFVLDRHHHFLSFVQGGKPGKQETALPGKGKRKGWCFPYGLFVLVVAVVFFCGGVGGSICYFLSLASGNVLGFSEVMMKF